MATRSLPRLIASSLFFVVGLSALAQTRYTVAKSHGISWFRDSEGQKLWSFGVCVVDEGTPFDDYDPSNPAFSAWRFYISKSQWVRGALEVLTSGGFNTVGAWSNYSSLLAEPSDLMKFTPIIHNGSSAGFPWLDMWDPKLVKIADDVTREVVGPLKRDKRIIGYFSDNELGWWRPGLFEWIWKQKTHNTRRRVIQLLEARYHGSWKSLLKDFDAGKINSWAALENRGQLYLRPSATGQPAISAVLKLLAKRYYQLCRHLIKKYDPGALYLGDRYISNYYPEVAEEAAKFCDVVSTNLNANWTDGGFAHYYLEGLEKITGKPMMVTEYYMCATENRSGNLNNHSGFPVVQTLPQRAESAKNTTLLLLENPNIVGAHWFQYYDEPQNGRGDGENYNFGLVDVNNRPYSELLSAFKSINLEKVHDAASPWRHTGNAIPPAPAADDMTKWDRDRAFVPSVSKIPRGDLYVAWTPSDLKLKMFWSEERFSESYFRDHKTPPEDDTVVTISTVDGAFKLKTTIGAMSKAHVLHGIKISAKYNTSSSLSIDVPAAKLRFEELKAGQRIQLKVTLDSQTRAYHTQWKIDAKLAK